MFTKIFHFVSLGVRKSHTNGRTIRMNSDGTVYILKWEEEELPDFIRDTKIEGIKIEALYFNFFIPLAT
ncbi:MAG: hypothetical protein VB110_10415 [Bacteroidales bacterium]|nr:hypothetical protein [Bacteroidales bacterium]